MRKTENQLLSKVPALAKKRDEQTKKLAASLTECLKEHAKNAQIAGNLVERLVSRVWGDNASAAYEALCKHHPIPRRTFDNLLAVGRGSMLPQLAFDGGVYSVYLRKMPLSEQRRLVIDKEPIEVAVKNGEATSVVQKRLTEVNATDCKRCFVGNGVVRLGTVKEQFDIIRKEVADEVRRAKSKNKAVWYVVKGNDIHTLHPRIISRQRLAAEVAAALNSIVMGTPASAISPEERELAKLLAQKIKMAG